MIEAPICGTERCCPGCTLNPTGATDPQINALMGEVAERFGPESMFLPEDVVYDALNSILPAGETNMDRVEAVIMAARKIGDRYCEGKYLDDYKGEKRVQWLRFLNTEQM